MKKSPRHYFDDIHIGKLALDKQNPRHPEFDSQVAVFEWFTDGNQLEGDKLYNLAKDIVENSLDPSERIMVRASEEIIGDYTVLEGNRRVAAIKLLNKPSIAPSDRWEKRFRKLSQNNYTKISKIPAVVFNDLELAFHFIELKHHGESGGAGRVSWDANQKARHEQRLNKRSRHHKALALSDFLTQAEDIPSDITKNAEEIPITTLDRLLGDKNFRDFLGLGIDQNGSLVFRIDPKEALKPIRKIITDFGTGEKNVRNIINKKQREEYRHEFNKENRSDLSKLLAAPIPVTGNVTLNQSKAKSRRHYGDPRKRKKLLIPGTSIPIDPKKFNRQKRIIDELNAINLRDREGNPAYPNAISLLLRLFIENSVDCYIKSKKLTHPNPKGWKEVSLIDRIKAVEKDLSTNHGLNKNIAKVIKKALGDVNNLAHPNSLNDLVHNPQQIPDPSDLITIWDRYSHFLISIWENID